MSLLTAFEANVTGQCYLLSTCVRSLGAQSAPTSSGSNDNARGPRDVSTQFRAVCEPSCKDLGRDDNINVD
jgi:hypothetical protein